MQQFQIYIATFGQFRLVNRVPKLNKKSVAGNLNHLLEYEKQQQLSNLAFAASIDGLKWLYSTDNSAVVALRTGGLMFTNAITPLKVLC